MENLKNKIVFITGASSGIGTACAQKFAEHGAKLILTARRIDRLKALADELKKQYRVEALTVKLDVRDAKQVSEVVDNLAKNWRQVDILINNAGLGLTTDKMQDADINNWDTMIDTNIKGLLYVTRQLLPGMLERKRGQIINIGSIAGHEYYPGGNVYCATKHAVKAITKSLLIDLLGTPIRVSSIDPGAVETEFSAVRWNDAKRAKEFYADFNPLTSADVADAVIYCASRPSHVNIAEIVILPTDQASANHIHRGGKQAHVFNRELTDE